MKLPKLMCLDCETTGLDWTTDKLHGIGVGYEPDKAEYYPAWAVPEIVREHLANPRIPKIGHNLHAFDAKFIRKAGFEIAGDLHNTQVLANLIDDSQKLKLKLLVPKYIGEENLERKRALDRYMSAVGVNNVGALCAKDLLDADHPHLDIIADYCKEDVINTTSLFFIFIEKLKEMEAVLKGPKFGFKKTPIDYYREEALPLERVLFEIEYRGIRVDMGAMERIRSSSLARMAAIDTELRSALGSRIAKTEEQLCEVAKRKVVKDKNKKPLAPNAKPAAVARRAKSIADATAKLIPGQGDCAFSWGNNNHVAELLYKNCGLPNNLIFRTDKGAYQTDKEAIGTIKANIPATSTLAQCLDLFSEYKLHGKIASTYTGTNKKGIISKVRYVDGVPRIFPEYRQTTGTGRLACIAEGQKVQVPGGEVPIENIKVGDWVYTYTDTNALTLRQVTAVIDNGIQECVKVKWQSSGDGSIGELICTPDHQIKHKYKGWMRADALKRYDKLLHVRREKLPNGRIRLYSTARGQELEEQVIKREYFNSPNNLHIHHIDEDKANNKLSNLAVVTNEAHQNIHALSRNWVVRDKAVKTPKTRLGVLRMLARAAGRPTYTQGDFASFVKLCQAKNISIKAVAQRYSGNKTYLSKGAVLRGMQGRQVHNAAKYLGVGLVKLKKLCWAYGITYNHTVLSVSSVGLRRVFDLSVADTENFIASEICVHNCKNPNMQNLKRDSEVKRFFIPDNDDEVFDDADYSQIELRTGAHITNDAGLCSAYTEGRDVHLLTASRLFNRPISKADDMERQAGKRTNFLTIFDGSAYRLMECLKADTGRYFSVPQCKDFINVWFDTYPGVRAYLDAQKEFFIQYKFCISETGRVRKLPDIYFGQHIKWIKGEQYEDEKGHLKNKWTPKYEGPQHKREELVKWVLNKNKKMSYAEVTEEMIGRAAWKRFSHAIKAGYNQPIQGLAASMTKRAMIALHNAGRIIANQVHDNLTVPRKRGDLAARQQLIDIMQNIYPLQVPVIADCKTISTFHPQDTVKE